jgi:hypothetical protein
MFTVDSAFVFGIDLQIPYSRADLLPHFLHGFVLKGRRRTDQSDFFFTFYGLEMVFLLGHVKEFGTWQVFDEVFLKVDRDKRPAHKADHGIFLFL